MNRLRPTVRAGFTLVELMMVILIIGMLMALLLPAINAVRTRARQAQIKLDVDQLATALEEFKSKYGAYPPNPDPGLPDAEIATFLRKMFPRYAPTQQDINIIKSMSEAEALVFWLGGLYNGNKMVGFSSDPRNPLAGTPNPNNPTGPAIDPFGKGVVTQRLAPFDFQVTRLYNCENPLADPSDTTDSYYPVFPEYYPPGPRPVESTPYVYFAARPDGTYLGIYTGAEDSSPVSTSSALGTAVPYLFTRDGVTPMGYVKPDGFQIICAGIDNDYGANLAKLFPHGANFLAGDEDNIVSFSGGTLQEAKP